MTFEVYNISMTIVFGISDFISLLFALFATETKLHKQDKIGPMW